MFDDLKATLRDLISARLAPDDRRAAVVSMKDALVRAKMGIDDLRDAHAQSQQRLAVEEAELATVERRRAMAEQIADAETVAIAERYARPLRERVVRHRLHPAPRPPRDRPCPGSFSRSCRRCCCPCITRCSS